MKLCEPGFIGSFLCWFVFLIIDSLSLLVINLFKLFISPCFTFGSIYKWQPTPVFLPGKSHGQRSVVGYTVHGIARVGHDLVTKQQQQICQLTKKVDL